MGGKLSFLKKVDSYRIVRIMVIREAASTNNLLEEIVECQEKKTSAAL